MIFNLSRHVVLTIVVAVSLVFSNGLYAVNWAKVAAYSSDAENSSDVVETHGALKKFVGDNLEQTRRTIEGGQSAAQLDKRVFGRGGTIDDLMKNLPGTGPIMKIAGFAENTKQRFTNTFKQAGAAKDNLSGTINNKFSWKSRRRPDNATSPGTDDIDKKFASAAEKRSYYDADNPYDSWVPKPEQAGDTYHIAKSHEFSDNEYENVQAPDEDIDLEPYFGVPFGAGPDGSITYNIIAGENNVLGLPGATGGNGKLTYTISPELPPGFEFNTSSRTIEGTPLTHGKQQTYTLEAMDEDGDTDTLTFHLLKRMNPEKLVSLFDKAKEGLQSQAINKKEVMTGIAKERIELARKNQAASNARLMQSLQNSMGRRRAAASQNQHYDVDQCVEKEKQNLKNFCEGAIEASPGCFYHNCRVRLGLENDNIMGKPCIDTRNCRARLPSPTRQHKRSLSQIPG